MKKSLIPIALLGALSGPVCAQSNLTIFGVVDVNLRSVKNGSAGSLDTLSTNGITPSRLGLRGVEDLGGGLRAGFWIEGAIDPDTGTPGGQNWQRRSTLSLLGRFGEIRLGRDYVPDFWNLTVFDPFGTNGVGSGNNLFLAGPPATAGLNGATTFFRANNSIGYFLPGGLGGLYGQVMVSAGEGVNGNKHRGLRVGYAAGPLNVALGHGKTSVTASSDWTRTGIGLSYDAGFARFLAQYNVAEATGGPDNGRKQRHQLLGAIVPFGAGNFKASYVATDGSGSGWGLRDARQLAFGYQHSLSKRTTLYAHVARIDNEGQASYTSTASGPPGMRAGEKSTGYEFGIRHDF